MSEPILVFVNDQPVRVMPDATAAAAVATWDATLAAKLAEGGAYLTDGRGIRLDDTALLFAGAIIRLVVSARAPRDEADAHA